MLSLAYLPVFPALFCRKRLTELADPNGQWRVGGWHAEKAPYPAHTIRSGLLADQPPAQQELPELLQRGLGLSRGHGAAEAMPVPAPTAGSAARPWGWPLAGNPRPFAYWLQAANAV